VTSGQVQALGSVLRGLVAQYRGLVALEDLAAQETAGAASKPPLLERMDEYAADGLDLGNLVPYPPQMQPIPVKPLFLDVAWNYIDYPRDGLANGQAQAEGKPEKKEGRRGWFGFGRS